MAENFKSCSVDGCKRNAHYLKGGHHDLCPMHYNRWYRHGDPLGDIPARASPGEPLKWLLETAATYTGDDCLIWPYGRWKDGYAKVREGNSHRYASRVLCEAVHGDPPSPDHQAAHSCGKGHEGCIHPGHLSWKTCADNQADRVIHGTSNRGERNNQSNLTEGQVLQIRKMAKDGHSYRDIALLFDISVSSAKRHVKRQTWAWL